MSVEDVSRMSWMEGKDRGCRSLKALHLCKWVGFEVVLFNFEFDVVSLGRMDGCDRCRLVVERGSRWSNRSQNHQAFSLFWKLEECSSGLRMCNWLFVQVYIV